MGRGLQPYQLLEIVIKRFSQENTMKVKCPTCSKEVVWTAEAKDRPFCSESCKLIDLVAWADESHAIPGKSAEEEMLSEQWEQIQNSQKDHSLH